MDQGLGAMFASGVVEGGTQLDPCHPLLLKHIGQSQDFRCVSFGYGGTIPLGLREVIHLDARHNDAVIPHAQLYQNGSS